MKKSSIVSRNPKVRELSDRFPTPPLSPFFRTCSVRIILFLTGLFASLSAMADTGDRWRVSEQDLTVWSSPDYLNKLGVIHRGYEIEEEAIDGDMIKFIYNGQTAYVATYCCERLAVESVQSAPEAKEQTGGSPKAIVETTTSKRTKDAASVTSSAQEQDTTQEASQTDVQEDESISLVGWIVMGVIYAIGLLQKVVLIWIVIEIFMYLFLWEKMRKRWNKRAGAPIMPEDRLSSLQNPFKLRSNYKTTKRFYGKHAAKVQLWWIILSYVMICYLIVLTVTIFIYYLMFRIALGFITAPSSSSSSSSGPDYRQVTDVEGNTVNVHRYPNGQMLDDNGNSYSKSGSSLRRDCDGSTFS